MVACEYRFGFVRNGFYQLVGGASRPATPYELHRDESWLAYAY
jgi:hypothetical protein